MAFFWEKEKKKRRKALGYSRRSTEDRQENSIDIQRKEYHAYAEKNDIEIVAEYEDAGVSGLRDDRPGFKNLMEHVRRSNMGKEKDLNYILCLEASRWSRQDPDLAAAYEAECRKHGVEVIFVSYNEDLSKENSEYDEFGDDKLMRTLMKSVDRTMSHKFCRTLSKRVFDGAKEVSEQGFRAGGPPPYGTLRLEVNEQRDPVGTMKPKQHKSYPNHRVKLTPDVEGNAVVVREIFELFVNQKLTEKQITAILNERNVSAPKGGKWRVESIQNILRNEQYAGSVVYNKTSQKKIHSVHGKPKRTINPRKDWIEVPNSYTPVIEPAVFEAAQAIFNLRKQCMPREEMLDRLRFAYKKYGMFSHALLKSMSGKANMPIMPSKREITKESTLQCFKSCSYCVKTLNHSLAVGLIFGSGVKVRLNNSLIFGGNESRGRILLFGGSDFPDLKT